ncbi:Protein NDR1 [Bienertia sinuspersici]
MVDSKETTKPSILPLIKWFIEVFLVLFFCCFVIRMCLIPWPPTYTITNYVKYPGTQEGIKGFSIKDRAEIKGKNTAMMFLLLITNSNKGKDIMYDEIRINVYKNGSLVGGSTLQGIFQSEKSNVSSLVLVNVNQHVMKLGDSNDESGRLKVELETKVRYIILGWITKQHLLNFEAFVPIDKSGKLSLGHKGIIFEPVMAKSFRLWIFIFFIALAVVALALWLDFRYQPPSFTIVEFSVPTTASKSQHHDIHVVLNIKNPNNVYSITYEYTILTINYGQETLGKSDLFVHHQPKDNEMRVASQVEAHVHQWEALLKAISKPPGEARLTVQLYTRIRYKNLGYNSKKSHLQYQGHFNIGSDGKISGKKKTVKLCKGSC